MTTLKEAIAVAFAQLQETFGCDHREEIGDFLASLEAGGFVIVPKEATDEMVISGDEAIIAALNRPHAEWSDDQTPAALCLAAAVAARPKIEGE